MSLTFSTGLGRVEAQHFQIIIAASAILLFIATIFGIFFLKPKSLIRVTEVTSSYAKFVYVSFFKPHTGDSGDGQQGALESFYKAQVSMLRMTDLHGMLTHC